MRITWPREPLGDERLSPSARPRSAKGQRAAPSGPRLEPLTALVVGLIVAVAAGPARGGVLLVPRSFPSAVVDKYNAVTGGAINVPFVATPGYALHAIVVDGNNHFYVTGDSGVIEYDAATGATLNSANWQSA